MKQESDFNVSEDERIAYEAGYQCCCYDHGIPFVRIRREWKDQVRWDVRMSGETIERISIEHLAQDIAREMKKEYEKYKQEKI